MVLARTCVFLYTENSKCAGQGFIKREEAKNGSKINGINHCAISVADIEETIQWYSDVFGLR